MLVVHRVRRSFGALAAVHDVSFTIPTASTFALIGPNGAGKTTTMRLILGIYQPDAGTIAWNGTAVDARTRRRFGYLPEERGLYGRMRVREQIVYFGRLHGVRTAAARTRADGWLERLDLGALAQRPCAELSKGNQQKVQLACAALHAPELLILDEPFSGLDPQNAETLIAIVRELRAAGCTIVLSSHQLWQLEALTDRVCVIAGGHVRADGTLAELRAAWPTRVVEVEPAAPALAAVLAAVPGARPPATNGARLAVEVPLETDVAALLRRLVAVGDVTRFERCEPSLEQIYLRAVGGAT